MTAVNAPFDLADLDEDYTQAEAPERKDFDEVPDGKYQVKVDKVGLTISQAGNRMLQWQLRVLAGAHANRVIFKQSMLETPENLKYLKGDLSTCGVELTKLSELPERLGDLLDICLEINKKTTGEFSSVYLNQRIVVDGVEDTAPGSDVESAACPF